MKNTDNTYGEDAMPQQRMDQMEHSMMDHDNSVFLDNSYIDGNQQYGLDYI